jgi:hypothetical protein
MLCGQRRATSLVVHARICHFCGLVLALTGFGVAVEAQSTAAATAQKGESQTWDSLQAWASDMISVIVKLSRNPGNQWATWKVAAPAGWVCCMHLPGELH